MAEFGSSENIMWFWAVLVFTVPPVLRFRENALVPALSALLTFGFYTQAYWTPDFYAIADWLWIGLITSGILLFYFICGFMVHYFWFRGKSERLKAYGAFSPLLKAWITGKAYVVTRDFLSEIRRLRMFEVAWQDINAVTLEGTDIVVSDGIEREPEILNEVRISKNEADYDEVVMKLREQGKL